jgi:hypothetical protein
MTRPHLVTPSDLKAARVPRSLAPAVAAALLALAVLVTERASDAPAPPVLLAEPAPPRTPSPAASQPQADRKTQDAYERAVDLYAAGRLRDSAAILEKLPDTPAAQRALARIRAELKSQRPAFRGS